MTGVVKSFGGVRALQGVDLTIAKGEIHALLGGNGAGKSTILKILNGVHVPDEGRIEVNGTRLTEHTPEAARRAGIAMIFQEMSLVPTLTVAQNIFLTREARDALGMIDDREAERRARTLFAELGVDIDPTLPVSDLSAGQQQLTEIVKATSQKASVLILDEPTTALSGVEVGHLFEFLARLKAEGVAIVYVSHRMDEIFKIADSATILRDGRRVVTAPLSEFTLQSMIEQIVGQKSSGFHDLERREATLGEPLVELRGVTGPRKPRSVDLVIHRGEVVGVAGLLGSGRSALARVLCGIDPLVAGEVRIAGKPVRIMSPRDAIKAGIALIPEDRRRQGFVAEHSVASNICLPVIDKLSRNGWVLAGRARRLAEEQIARLRVKTASPDSPVRTLSGGNAQKVVIAKWLAADPRVIVLDEPTAGIDIGSKSEIVALIRELASQGKAVIIISSELPELLAASDRIVVMSNGELVRDISRAELDAATAGARDPVEREQLAERQLQLALQHRAQQFTRLLGKGPNGEEPEIAANIGLTEVELARIQAMNARAAIVLHYGENDWTRGQVEGLRHQFAEMGVEVVAITDAGFDGARQAADIEAVLAQQPDVIVSIPVDAVATASAYAAAAGRGVKLIFMENTPRGLVAGKDYVSVVSADNYGNGAASAELMADVLGGEGDIGAIAHAADFFATRERREAFGETLARRFPKVRIVSEESITGPDFAADAERAASAMLRAHPSLKGIWAVWDVPAEGVIAAAKAAGRNDLVVTTIDLGHKIALEMARGGVVKGVAAQRVYDQGVTEALLAGFGLLGKPAPAYVALPALPVTKADLVDAWQIVYRSPNPDLQQGASA
ncbi:MAG: ATP-binding cassette domain-containing protein [Acetobacteraceae bacterium]|nr:ATP-binding cassette domain-containing protein [Acetobacteraceae bacterium]